MSRSGRSAAGDPSQPDFASVYAGDAVLTPRLAAHLWVAAVYLSDTYGEAPHSEMLSEELPPNLHPPDWFTPSADVVDPL